MATPNFNENLMYFNVRFLVLRNLLCLIRELLFFNIFEPEDVVFVEFVINFVMKNYILKDSNYG